MSAVKRRSEVGWVESIGARARKEQKRREKSDEVELRFCREAECREN